MSGTFYTSGQNVNEYFDVLYSAPIPNSLTQDVSLRFPTMFSGSDYVTTFCGRTLTLPIKYTFKQSFNSFIQRFLWSFNINNLLDTSAQGAYSVSYCSLMVQVGSYYSNGGNNYTAPIYSDKYERINCTTPFLAPTQININSDGSVQLTCSMGDIGSSTGYCSWSMLILI